MSVQLIASELLVLEKRDDFGLGGDELAKGVMAPSVTRDSDQIYE